MIDIIFPYLYGVVRGPGGEVKESVWQTSRGVFCTVPGLPASPDLAHARPFAMVNVCPGNSVRVEARGQDCHAQPFLIVGDGLPGDVVTVALAVHRGLPIPRTKSRARRIK